MPPRPQIAEPPQGEQAEDYDPTTADRRRQPELDPTKSVEKKEPLDNEFLPDTADELEENTPRVRRRNDLMQGAARLAPLDRSDDLGM